MNDQARVPEPGTLPTGDEAWAPATCTLPTAERPPRVAEWDALFARRLRSAARTGPLALRLEWEPLPETAEKVRELADRERGCCSFFSFDTTADADGIVLDVTVDAPHAVVLDALAARAAGREGR
ncbi:hypothetical protein ACGFYZ_34270 [Streptomyces sp. NPDC048330]|uniref:hypothetical protein n=1 Tax=Streptomyces sp. NPDC048330 TaxID=3365533 RepID=UPI003722AD3C